MKTTHRLILIVASGSLLGLACSGRDGGGDEPVASEVSSGLPQGDFVDELSTDDAETLCDAGARAAQAVITPAQFCTFFALVEAITFDDQGNPMLDRDACEQDRDACIADDATPASDMFTGECNPDAFASCSATVGSVEACLSARLAQVDGIFAAVSCSRTPTRADIEGFDPNAAPEACAELPPGCPGAPSPAGS